MRANPRPKVRLTVARVEGQHLTHLQAVLLWRVMAHHGQANRDLVSYACLTCGSIGESESQEARDHNEKYLDFTCCAPERTVIFRTEEV